MGARLAGALLGTVALCALAQPAAASTFSEGSLTVSGSLAASWHGDPARGCGEAGLCGYRGGVVTGPAGDGQLQLENSGGRPRYAFGYANLASTPVVRVVRGDSACVDVASAQEIDLSGAVRHGRVRFVLSSYGLDASRCAGPDASEFVERLPRRSVSLARLRRGGVTLDFSGRVPYGSGRFSGAIRSTLRVKIGRLRVHHFPDERHGPGRRSRSFRVVRLHAVYRVIGLQGSIRSAFRGLRKPFCVTLDSCGSAGTSGWAIFSATGGTLYFDGAGAARPGDRGLRGAVAAIERGQFAGYTYASFRHAVGATTSDVRLPDGSRCHDASRAAAPELDAQSDTRRIEFRIGGEGLVPAIDLLHVGCPGPVGTDIFGRHALASGSAPASALLRRRLAVSMTSHGRFHSFGYTGTRRARVGLRLRRVGIRVSYGHVRR